MNHYDDLQRFKDKTHTQNLTFKDLSGQSSVAERGDWAIMNQLVPSADEKNTLFPNRFPAQLLLFISSQKYLHSPRPNSALRRR